MNRRRGIADAVEEQIGARASREIGHGIQDCLTRIKRERRLAVTLR